MVLSFKHKYTTVPFVLTVTAATTATALGLSFPKKLQLLKIVMSERELKWLGNVK